ncbi:MAG: hypothetical protein M3071_03500 [Actinomycetota bacterium]|nr:hypothetical protein [Actinomycetota bacterium]
MSDLLGDQRAKDLLAADPGVVHQLVAMFGVVAAQAQTTGDGLKGAVGDENWTGGAAEAFKHGVGSKFPDELGKVTSSYREAADALGAFEGQLSSLKPAFQSIVSQLQSLQSQLASAQSQLSSAQSALGTAQAQAVNRSFTAPLSPPASVPLTSPLYTAVNAAAGTVNNLNGEIGSLTGRGFQLLDDFDSARGAAQDRVSHAAQVPPHRGWWQSALNVVVSIGKFIIHPLTDLPSAVANFYSHPGWETLGKLTEDVAGTALLVATVVAPFAAPELLAADAAEATAAEGAAAATEGGLTLQGAVDITNGVANYGTKAAAAINVVQDVKGHNLNAAVIDTTFGALPDASNYLGIGDQQVKQAEGTVTALGDLQNAAHQLPLPADIQNAVAVAAGAAKPGAEQYAKESQWIADRIGAPVAWGGEQLRNAAQKPVDHSVCAPHG